MSSVVVEDKDDITNGFSVSRKLCGFRRKLVLITCCPTPLGVDVQAGICANRNAAERHRFQRATLQC